MTHMHSYDVCCETIYFGAIGHHRVQLDSSQRHTRPHGLNACETFGALTLSRAPSQHAASDEQLHSSVACQTYLLNRTHLVSHRCVPHAAEPVRSRLDLAMGSGKHGGLAGRTLGEYLAARLVEIGVEKIFGVPGDYTLVLLVSVFGALPDGGASSLSVTLKEHCGVHRQWRIILSGQASPMPSLA